VVFVVCGRAVERLPCVKRCTGGVRWSQTVLCTTTLGSESLYSCFDPVQMAIMLTGVHGRTVFPGIEEPCGTW